MTDNDLAKIESQLKVRLPSDYRQLLATRSAELSELTVHYPWGASPYLSDRLYTDAQRIIEVNQIERRSDTGTGGAFPGWHKQFILIGDDGGGGYYCLRIDNKPGVYLIGSDSGDQPELKAPSLAVYVDDVLGDFPSMSRRYPAPGRSSFDAACEPHERVGIFLGSQVFPGNGRIVYQGDDRGLTLESLAAAGVDRAGIHGNVVKVVAALLQCPPTSIAVNSYTEEGDPALKLDVTGMPMQLNGRPYWYADLQVHGKIAEIIFHGFVEEIPPKIAFEWRNLTTPLVALIKAAYPGTVKISGSPAKPPMRRGDRLIYTLPFDLRT